MSADAKPDIPDMVLEYYAAKGLAASLREGAAASLTGAEDEYRADTEDQRATNILRDITLEWERLVADTERRGADGAEVGRLVGLIGSARLSTEQRNALNDLMLLAITGRTKRSGQRDASEPSSNRGLEGTSKNVPHEASPEGK